MHGKFRWVICALLFFACMINYMDRQVLGLLKPELMKIFHWSERDFGTINITFQAAYAIGQTAFGPIIEFIGTKSTYAFALVFWSLAAMAHALAKSVAGFSLVRFALGAGESGNFPTAVKTVVEWFPPRERSVANGIFNAGSNVGSIFAPLLVPWLFYAFGWQGAFITLGLAGLIWVVFWLALYNSPEKSHRITAAELTHIQSGVPATAEKKISWTKLLGYREAWAYYGTCVLVGPVWWFYGFWLPGFFHDQFNLDIRDFGLPLAFVATVTCLGSVGGGGLSAWFLKRGWSVNAARKTASMLCACCTLPVIFAPQVASPWLAATFFALAGAAHQGWSATMYTVVSDMFPKRAVASVVGFGGTLAGLMSMGFFWLVSTILQDQGQYKTIMLMCGIAYVIAWLIFHLGVPKIKPVDVK
jgi:ACS family hexuronate transporter-like MFS transporter